jgi:ABC-type Fe3+/spermidine/putrescine transport system ATPase subunit
MRIEQFGSPRDIFWHPKTRFVAEFMGVTNFLRATVVRGTGKAVELSLPGASFVCPLAGNLKPGAIEIVVRPEWINLSREPSADNPGIRGRLADAEFHGSISRFTVNLDGGGSLTVKKTNNIKDAASGFQFSIGENIWVSWAPEAMQILAL